MHYIIERIGWGLDALPSKKNKKTKWSIKMTTKKQLEAILAKLNTEQDISYGELVFLQDHRAEIKKNYPTDPVLCQWAGIDESEYRGARCK